MISAWTKHIKDEAEKDRFRNSVLGSKSVLVRLQELMDEMKGDIEDLELNPKVYDIPNWDYRQADINGYKRCLKQITKIITLDQKE